jgi:arsenite methyltransferase
MEKTMSDTSPVNSAALREEVKKQYRDVVVQPHATYPFRTSRPLAARLGYDVRIVEAMPDEAVESFAGVANPFSLRDLKPAGAGFDCFAAAGKVAQKGVLSA